MGNGDGEQSHRKSGSTTVDHSHLLSARPATLEERGSIERDNSAAGREFHVVQARVLINGYQYKFWD